MQSLTSQMIDGVFPTKAKAVGELSKLCAQSSDKAAIYDKTGRAIAVGDVLKVYHFTAALRRKKHYMYKQVVANDNFRDGTPVLRVSHLDLSGDGYTLICDGSHLADYEIVQSIDCKHEDRPRPTAAP
ncbi:hypothetical protein [Rhizobium sp. 768_B6_N1_8]